MMYETGVEDEENIVSVTNATLISALNSANVLKRIAAYYSEQQSVTNDIIVGKERPGDEVYFKTVLEIYKRNYENIDYYPF